MSAHPAGYNPLDQFGVFVNEPRLTQNIGRRVFQLENDKIILNKNGQKKNGRWDQEGNKLVW